MPILGKPRHALAITPNDTLSLRQPSQYLSFANATGGASTGTIYIDTVGGEVNVGITLPQGMYAICATRVYATNTTATDIVEYWDE